MHKDIFKERMKPDFIGIGAIKTGTGWLYQNLRVHPEIWMPPFKELHYFDDYDNKSPHSIKILKKQKYYKYKSGQLKSFLKHRGYLQSELRSWFYRYYCLKTNDKWYQSLFASGKDLICGEITPHYDTIGEEPLEALKRINPAIKIIYCIRNPYERALSSIRMRMNLRRDLEMEKLVNNSISNVSRSDYINNYKKWLNHFDKDQILIVYFDQFKEDPRGYLDQILQFLGVNSMNYELAESFTKKYNSFNYKIETTLTQKLAQAYLPLVTDQHSFFDSRYTAKWVEDTIVKASA